MEKKHRVFIYDRKEMGILTLLAILVAAFAFTLGVHLGKRVGFKGNAHVSDVDSVATAPDKIPDRQEIQEQTKGAQQAVDESLNQALHDEVARTGIKLDSSHQVELPKNTKNEANKPHHGDANSGDSSHSGHSEAAHPKSDSHAKSSHSLRLEDVAAAQRSAPEGTFTLQIGSHPGLEGAKHQVDAIEGLGFKPFLRIADVKGKGRWYRIYLGGYETRDEAEKAGNRYRSQKVVDSFVIAKIEE